jgi:prevent-host-death family protein
MTATYTASEARAKLPELLDLVERGEDVTVTRHGRVSAVLVNPERWHRRRALTVFEEADRLRAQFEAERGQPLLPPVEDMDAEQHIAWIRVDRDAR